MKVHRYARGDRLFEEGLPPDFFYTIASGRVKLFKMTPSGKDVIIDILGPGSPVGSDAAYNGHPFAASAVAIEDTTCVLVPHRTFLAMLEQHPSLARGLGIGLSQRLTEMMSRIADLTGGRVESRLARLFVQLACHTGRTKQGEIFIPVSLSRRELADLTGTTIETCIRIMSRWGKQNIVRTREDGFIIIDRKTLKTLTQADHETP